MVPNHVFQLLCDDGDGAADLASTPTRSARRRPKCSQAMPAGRRPSMRCAASTAPATVLGKPVPGLSRASRTSRPTPTSRPMSRCKLEIDNWRWAGVPFYLRTGKHMTRRMTEIAIRFKPAPMRAVRGHAGRRAAAELAGASRSSRTRASRCSSRSSGPGPTVELAAGARWTSPTSDWFPHAAERRLRDAALRRDDRRPDAVPARRHGRGRPGASCSRCSTPGRRRSRDFPNYAAGSDGPGGGGRAAGARWRPRLAPTIGSRRQRRIVTSATRSRCCSPTSTARWSPRTRC